MGTLKEFDFTFNFIVGVLPSLFPIHPFAEVYIYDLQVTSLCKFNHRITAIPTTYSRASHYMFADLLLCYFCGKVSGYLSLVIVGSTSTYKFSTA